MDKTRAIFFFSLLAIVIAIFRYHSPSQKSADQPAAATPGPSVSPPIVAMATPPPVASVAPEANSTPVAAATPFVQPNMTPSGAFQKVAPRVAPAVAMISVFDDSGKFLRSGAGCFVSHEGRLVTSASLVQGAAHGVAKVSDGRIINISGILTESVSADVAVLQVDTKRGVSYLSPNKSAATNAGTRVAVLQSPLQKQKPGYFEGVVPEKGSEPAGEWLETGISVPKESVGAPVVNEKGELLGIVTSQRPAGANSDVARKSGSLETLLAGINPGAPAAWQIASNEPQSPSEGPLATPSASPSRFAKIPVVQADRPGHTRLISSPKPAYPTAARHSYFPLKGTGRYRVSFDANGQVKGVAVLESTRSDTLDAAAVDALKRWKAAPGQEWSATVPVTFQP